MGRRVYAIVKATVRATSYTVFSQNNRNDVSSTED